MARYASKPHMIDAFQFTGEGSFKPPKWFVEAYHSGEVQVTMDREDPKNPDKNYIVVYGERNMEKALLNYWLCRADHGKIYVLDNTSFEESYELRE